MSTPKSTTHPPALPASGKGAPTTSPNNPPMAAADDRNTPRTQSPP